MKLKTLLITLFLTLPLAAQEPSLVNGTGGGITNPAFRNAVLPSQTSQAGKYLKTDGSAATWETAISGIADGDIPLAKLSQSSATTGQVAKWNGSLWAPGQDDGADPLSEAPGLYDVFSDETKYDEGATITHNSTMPLVGGTPWRLAISNSYTAGAFVTGHYYRIVTVGTTSFTSIGASANTVGVDFTATGAGSGTGTATLLEVHAAGAFVTGRSYRIVAAGTTDFTLIGASANTVGTDFVATGPGSGTGTASSIVVPKVTGGAYIAPVGMSHYYLSNVTPSANKRFTVGLRFKWFSTPFAKYRGDAGPPSVYAASLTNFSFAPNEVVSSAGSIIAGTSQNLAHLNMNGTMTGEFFEFFGEAAHAAGTASGNVVTLTTTPYTINTGDFINISTIPGGALPTGLANGNYYAIMDSPTQIRFATSRANALAGRAVTLSSAGTAGWAVKQIFEEVETSLPASPSPFKIDGEYTLLISVDNDYLTTVIPGYGYRKFYHPRLDTKVGSTNTHFWVEPNGLGIPPNTYQPEGFGLVAIWAQSTRLNDLYSGVLPGTKSAETTTTYGGERNFREVTTLSYPFENTTPSLSSDHSYATYGKVASMGVFPSATLELLANPTDGETVVFRTLQNGASPTWTWRNTLGASGSYTVKIGATREESASNLNAAIMNTGGSGTIYSAASPMSQYRSYVSENLLHVDFVTLTTGTIALSETMANGRWIQANMKPAVIPSLDVMLEDRLRRAPINFEVGQSTVINSNATGTPQNLLTLYAPPMYAIGNSADFKIYGTLAANTNSKTVAFELGFAGATPITITTTSASDTSFVITGRMMRLPSGTDRCLYAEIITNTGLRSFGRQTQNTYPTIQNSTAATVITTSVASGDIKIENYTVTHNY